MPMENSLLSNRIFFPAPGFRLLHSPDRLPESLRPRLWQRTPTFAVKLNKILALANHIGYSAFTGRSMREEIALSSILGAAVYDSTGALAGHVREVALSPREDRGRISDFIVKT